MENKIKEFAEWLETKIVDPWHAEAIARQLVENHDFWASQKIEIPSRFMKDGRPMLYDFDFPHTIGG